ncbi:hypothetical protein QLQ12_02550 [Actinoplanes sp. NEAU-A12]|uniref:LysR family transcriptional regulator n=1 Tax=Actinoplanes sandaracinus TaxID=3045177 RepID=A0ABT6WCQ3_9ACTN|nr:hypothetical protein [Actinoplanes sandaracinus]MDI6097478.1 hypothetical protein [Actinoplanes sandaracinus]
MPIHDAPPGRWALIWRTAGVTEMILDFVRAAREVGPVAPNTD